MDYVAGYVIFNDITARDIQRREMESGVFSFCKAIDTFCPLGPWIVTADEIPDPHDLAMELRVNGEVRQTSHSSRMAVTIPEIVAHYSALGYSAGDVLSTGTVSGVAGSAGRGVPLSQARRRDGGRDREDRRPPQPGDLVAGRPRRAGAAARAVVGRRLRGREAQGIHPRRHGPGRLVPGRILLGGYEVYGMIRRSSSFNTPGSTRLRRARARVRRPRRRLRRSTCLRRRPDEVYNLGAQSPSA